MAASLSLANASVCQKYECGMHRTDAPLIEAIVALTDGAVTAQDMHETRLEWLAVHRPALVDDIVERGDIVADAGGAVSEIKPQKLSRQGA
tara:strand:+ start:4823 stop:5095 length:273 start_codon:yes stop_codon:yes gene_type:complete